MPKKCFIVNIFIIFAVYMHKFDYYTGLSPKYHFT